MYGPHIPVALPPCLEGPEKVSSMAFSDEEHLTHMHLDCRKFAHIRQRNGYRFEGFLDSLVAQHFLLDRL